MDTIFTLSLVGFIALTTALEIKGNIQYDRIYKFKDACLKRLSRKRKAIKC